MGSVESAAKCDAECYQAIHVYLLGRVKDEVFQVRPGSDLISTDETAVRPGRARVAVAAKRSGPHRNATPARNRLRFVVLAFLLVLGIGCSAAKESKTEKALEELRRAFAGTRPAEARLSAFPEHEPFSYTRGKAVPAADPAALERAKGLLGEATRGNPEKGSLHAFGLLYLVERDLDRAEQEFRLALTVEPDNARIHSDLGALHLEKARMELFEWSPSGLNSLDLSLKHLDRAIELSPQMPEPRFNKALVLDAFKLPSQAKAAWQEYLEIDRNSKWADEARDHMRRLDIEPAR